MRKLQGYRYFLGVRPDAHLLPLFQRIGEAIGLQIRLDLLHLTLCVIGQTTERDRFLRSRIGRALDGQQLHSFAVNLSRVQAGAGGAYVRTTGRQDEIQDFFRLLVTHLRACGIEPLHRKSGLHPHVTLAYSACRGDLLKIALSWFPDALLLIESEVGLSKHSVLASWPLLPPRQTQLPFDAPTLCAAPVDMSNADLAAWIA